MNHKWQSNAHIGVWMDHQHARLVHFKPDGTPFIEEMESDYVPHDRERGQGSDKTKWGGHYRFSDNESKKNHSHDDLQHKFYLNLEEKLKTYDTILLAGPTTAKTELFNLILKNKSFDGKRIAVENADKLTDNQLVAMVHHYFEELHSEKH